MAPPNGQDMWSDISIAEVQCNFLSATGDARAFIARVQVLWQKSTCSSWKMQFAFGFIVEFVYDWIFFFKCLQDTLPWVNDVFWKRIYLYSGFFSVSVLIKSELKRINPIREPVCIKNLKVGVPCSLHFRFVENTYSARYLQGFSVYLYLDVGKTTWD